MTDKVGKTDATPARDLAVSIIGAGPDADAWARALRGVEGVTVRRLPGTSEDGLLEDLSRAGGDAVAFTAGVPDVANAIKRAVMAGRDVLVAAPVALASKHLLALDDLSRRREHVILFDTGSLDDERLAFVRKMTGSAQALWRPRYLRSLRTGPHGQATLDELAVADLATVLGIAGGLPWAVSAFSPRVDDETGIADVAMTTLTFEGGPVARIDVSLVEPRPRHEIVVACDGRTISFDEFDSRAPLQIHASGKHRGPRIGGQWAETVTEHPLGEAGDRIGRAAALFVRAVRERGVTVSNARELADAALVWETARASIARGGELLPLPSAGALVEARRPELQVIRGGGRTVAGHAPELTLVRESTPPRSA